MDQQDRGGLARLRHDLRTCVNQILGYSELLREDAEEVQPQFVPDLDRIHASGRRVLTLLDGLFADAPAAARAAPAEGATEAPPGAAPAVAGTAGGGRILVVDDDEMNRDMLSRRLRKHGFEVALAEHGQAALRLAAADCFDLVLLDWMMPGMSGLDVLAALRRDRSAAELPVIMATAKGESEDIVAAFGSGANDYVTKPFDFPVVLARVHTQLALKRAVDENRALLRHLEIRNRFIRQTFGRYMTDEIVSSLLDDRTGLDLGGEKRRISILITDLRGFSAIAGRMEPHRVVRMLNLYFDVMTDIIMAAGGTIDEFIGDSILAFFGAPARHPDHARAAVACAVRMQLGMEEVNRRNAALGLPPIEMGIGIHTGDVVLGNVGSERRAKYGIFGGSVNLASRIESYTVGGQILASASTIGDVGDEVLTGRRIDVRPKGFAAPIPLFEIVGLAGDPALRLQDADPPLVALAAPEPIRFVVIDGKDAGGPARVGQLLALSPRGAELRIHPPLELLANIRFGTAADAPGAAHPRGTAAEDGEIYGKVVVTGSNGTVQVRFTFASGPAQAWIQRMVAEAEASVS